MTPHFLPSLLALLAVPLALAHQNASTTCTQLGSSLSGASDVYYPGSSEYDAGVKHWANSSSQAAACVVQPGSAQDVGKILKLVGRTRTPFAVKGGGHATNQGFSSTTGVQIAMSRFRQIDYSPKAQSVIVGAGLVWDDIYAALDPHNVTVVGGRVSGVGVAGFTLGGGYSYLSNMYGLASDNVLQYELVLPSGKVVHVDAASHPDLFFGLRGGFNNLGVVTKFTLKTHPLGLVWGGSVFVSPEHAADVFAATAKFQTTNKDPKAAMIMGTNSVLMPAFGPAPIPLINLILFYASPNPAPGVFDDFVKIPTLDVQGSGLPFGTASYSTLVIGGNVGADSSIGPRAVFNTYGFTDYSVEFLNSVLGETILNGQDLLNNSLVYMNVAIEPFLNSALSHSTTPSLYPASRKQVYLPTNLYLSWVDPTMDQVMHNAARDIIGRLKAIAVSLGDDLGEGGLYPNYAIAGNGTSVEDFWGQEHVTRLRVIRKVYDPSNVMGLAGGWRV